MMNIQDKPATSQELSAFGLAVAALLGLSTTIVGYFEQLWVGLLVALGGVIAVAFFTAVGRHLLPKAAKPTADWIHNSLARLFAGYRKYYLRHAIEFEHRNFDVKGLSTQNIYTLELQQVFVDLTLAPMAPHQASGDPIERLPEALQAGRHSIWQYLGGHHGKPQHLAVLGAPGSGKTTLMKHMALSLALRGVAKPSVKYPELLPVLLFLRDHAAAIKTEDDYSLIKAIDAEIKHLSGQQPPPGWFERMLSSGRCLILLDGLDEVADPLTRRKVVDWVEKQMQAHGGNAFVVTSRPFGYRDYPLSGVTVLDVRPFTAEQVERFVHNWYLANEIKAQQREDAGVQRDAKRGAEDLLSRLWGTPALSDLAVNPLLLTMIATVHRYRSSLPGRRVELYSEICEVFLGKRSQAKGLQLDLTPAQRQTVLEPLAFQMMRRRIREIDRAAAGKVIAAILKRVGAEAEPDDFLTDTQNNSGLLIERENGVFAFAHLTFQEFLAAAHIQKGKLEEELTSNIADSWWHETIRLYAAQADASPIIEACIGSDPIQVPALVLAIECQEEAKEITPALRKRLNGVLNEGLDAVVPEKSSVISEALLTLRLKRLIRIDDSRYIDASLISNAEYQLFLDDIRREARVYKPDHWSGEHYAQGCGHDPILGVRHDDAVVFCMWLTAREDGPWVYRLPRPDEAAVSAGYEDSSSGYWMSIAAGESGFADAAKEEERQPLRLAEFARNLALDLAFGIARDLANDLDRASHLALDRPLNLDRARANDLASALALARAGARDLASALALARAHDPVHDPALARASDLASTLVNDFARASDPDLARANDFARDLANDLDRPLNLAHTLANDLASALANDLARSSDLDRALAPALASALAHDPDLALARDLDLDLASDPDLALARDLARDLAHPRNVAPGSILRRESLQDLQQTVRILGALMQREHQVSQQWNAEKKRLHCIFLTIYLMSFQLRFSWLLDIANWPKRKRKKYAIDQFAFDVESLAWAVTAFEQALEQIQMLRQRIDGEAEPFEGVRIVRERRIEERVAA